MAGNKRKNSKHQAGEESKGSSEQQTSTYRVLMEVSPAVILGEPKIIKLDQGEIRFWDIIHPKMQVPKGIGIMATLPASDIDTAMSRARGLTNRILSIFSILTNTSFPDLQIMRAYDVTPGKKSGTFQQFHYDLPLESVSTRSVDKKALDKGVQAISRLPESDNDSVLRAMHWYRLALQSRDVLVRFTTLWIGLETINTLLRRHYELDIEYATCTKCGHKTTETLNGVKRLLEEVDDGTQKWRITRRLRAGTIHGFQALKDITPELRHTVPILEKALGRGLNLILGLESHTVSNPANLGNPVQAYYTSTALIEGPNLQLVDQEIVPGFIYQFEIFEPQEHGQHHNFRAKPQIDKTFSFRNAQHALYVQPQVAENVVFTPLPE